MALSQAAAPPLIGTPRRGLTAGLVLLVTLVAFEGMAVSAIMPVVARDLHGLSFYAWGFSAYFTAGLPANVLAGIWADARGPARPMLTGLALFLLGLVLAGGAPSMPVFVAARAVQGFGGGAMVVAMYVVIASQYGEEGRARVFAWLSAAWVLPSLTAPSLCGLVAQYVGWRPVFFGLMPFVLPGALLLGPALRAGAPSLRPARGSGYRALAACAVALGMSLLLYAGHRPALVLALTGVSGGVLLLAGLPHLLPAGALRLRPGLPATVALRGLVPAVFFGVSAFIPLTLTQRHHFAPALAGVVLTVGSLGWSAGSWAQGHPVWARYRLRLIRAGVATVTVTAAAAISIDVPGVPGWVILPIWVVAGFGTGVALSSMNVLIMELSTPEERGANTAALSVCDTLGSSLATGLAGIVAGGCGGGAPSGMLMVGVAGVALAGTARLGDPR